MASILSLDCWLSADQELVSVEELFLLILAGGVSELVDGLSGVVMIKAGAVECVGSLDSLDSWTVLL